MILYSYFRSSCSYRVRIALNLKNIAPEFRYINLHPEVNENLTEDFLAINPEGRVPYFVDGDVHLSQSTAIIEYLEENYPDVPLLPSSLAERAAVRQLVNVIACDMQPVNNVGVLRQLKQQFQSDQDNINHWYGFWIERGFSAVESILDQRSGDFCIGDSPTMADVYLVPQVWNAHRFSISLAAFPNINRIVEQCNSLKAFSDAAPEKQADNPA